MILGIINQLLCSFSLIRFDIRKIAFVQFQRVVRRIKRVYEFKNKNATLMVYLYIFDLPFHKFHLDIKNIYRLKMSESNLRVRSNFLHISSHTLFFEITARKCPKQSPCCVIVFFLLNNVSF